MKKLSRLKTSLFSLPLILAAIILVFISSDNDKNIVKGVFSDMTQVANADVPAAGDCAAGDCDCAAGDCGAGCPNTAGDEGGDVPTLT